MPYRPRRLRQIGSAARRQRWYRPALAVGLAGWLAATSGTAADYASLSQVEAATETRDYSQQVRDKKFAADQRAFLSGILLPQLSKDANRAGIARTRQRIRELALRDAAKELVDPINGTLRDAMLAQATAPETEPLLRVNAMLLVGELVGADGKPWPAAAKPLADAAADAKLPLDVRIAAVAGLSQHVRAAASGAPEVAAIAGPAVAGLVTTPPEGDPVARRWLVTRALELLPAVAPPPAAIAAAAGILADEAADTDLRVRAAAALGRLARPEAGIDAAVAVGHAGSLAVAALETDLAAAEQRRFTRRLSGGAGWAGAGGLMSPAMPGFGGGMPGAPWGGEMGAGEGLGAEADEDAVPSLACRRDAWRLFRLAEAIKPARSGPGLADLLEGDAAAAAGDLASTLRQAALDLDAGPNEATLKQALDAIKELGPAAKAQPATGGAKPEAAPPKPAEESPF